MTMRNYTTAEYRQADIDAGPFALEGNPDPEKRNYRTSRRTAILGGVMHITVGMSDYELPDVSAEGTTKYGADTTRDASWHVCIDSDGIIPSIRDAYVAWHAGVVDIANVNDATLGMEIGTGTTDWRSKQAAWVDRTIRNAAVWWAPRVIKYGIPIRLENSRTAIADAIASGRKFGFTSHKIIAPSNRTDPGWVDGVDTFPWSMFFQFLREEIATRQGTTPAPTWEDDMALSPEGLAQIKALLTKDADVNRARAIAVLGYKNTDVDSGDVFQNIVDAGNAQAIDYDRLAAAIVAKLPADAGDLTMDQVRAASEAAMRTVLGSVDNEPSPT